METPYPPRNRSDFKIAIICALPPEADMVQAVMDQDWADHGRRYSKASRDRNAYTTGVIGRHNVVLVHMPGMGNTSSASVATDLRSSFQDIEIVFVVGICGIVPIKPETKDEIVLGDCIISTSVVQYDNGRCFPEGFAQKKGTEDILGRANPVIRALIAKLTTITNWARLTNQLAASLRGLRASPHKITYPGTARDKLFDTKYIHQHHGSDSRCDKCVPNKNTCTRDCETLRCEDVYLVNRERLSSSGLSLLYPRIHFGVFGSANTVMRSGQDRDDLSKEFGIIAFDMEGAGIWDQFPTIIIKAGCDYADSHKNKTWQKYAAASAASTLKAFLDELETSQESLSGNVDIDAGNLWVNQQHHIRARFPMPIGHPGQLQPQNYMGHRNFPEFSDSRIIQGLPGMSVGDMYAQRPMTTVYKTLGLYNDLASTSLAPYSHIQTLAGTTRAASTLSLREIHNILGAPLYDDPLQRHAAARLDGTCEWMFRKGWYQNWSSYAIDDASKFLWLYNFPGTGKTTICATIISELQKSSNMVLHYFSSAHDQSQNDLTIIIRHWLLEIIRKNEDGRVLILYALQELRCGLFVSSSDIWAVFGDLVPKLRNCVFVLDGFDEYKKTFRVEFLIKLKDHLKGSSSKVLITSRDETDIRFELTHISPDITGLEVDAYQITKVDTEADIQMLSTRTVNNKLPEQDGASRSQLTSTLVDKCDGMFLWITLAAEQLKAGKSPAALKRTVNKAPVGLHSLYEQKWKDILQEPDSEERTRAIAILNWCTYCLIPLTVAQLSEALVVQSDDTAKDFDEDELPTLDNNFITNCIMRLCGSFVDLRSVRPGEPLAEQTLHLIHGSTKDFLSSVLPPLYPSTVSAKLPSFQNSPHLLLSKICLRYLCFENVDEDSTRFDDSCWTFCHYAKEHWHQHQCMSQIADEEYYDLVVKFLDVLNKNFLSWSAGFESTTDKFLIEANFNFPPAAPLYYATVLDIVPAMEIILRTQSPDINARGGWYGTALQAACIKGNEACFELLIASKADINIEAGRCGTALIAAADEGHLGLLKKLLLHSADLNKKGFIGETAVFLAAGNERLEIVKSLISHGADIDIPQHQGWTPLMFAALGGYIDIVRIFLQQGASHASRNKDGHDALLIAVASDNAELVKLLLDHGADIDTSDNRGWSALMIASEHGHSKIVGLLLDHGADTNALDNRGWSALIIASYYGHSEVVELLLDRGARVNANGVIKNPVSFASTESIAQPASSRAALDCDVNTGKVLIDDEPGHTKLLEITGQSDRAEVLENSPGYAPVTVVRDNKFTALHVASCEGHEEVVKLLLRSGADTAGIDKYDNTALHYAAEMNHVEIVKLLLSNGANPVTQNGSHALPVHKAAILGHKEVVQILLSQDIDPDILNDPQNSLLHGAVEGGHKMVALFLDRGYDINAVGINNTTALFRAIDKSDALTVRLLLEHGVHYDIKNMIGVTPLHLASQDGQLEIVRLLLQKGADVTVVGDYGWTPLHFAAARGHTDVVQVLLLEKGVDVKIVNEHGQTPLHCAAACGHAKIVQVLLSANSDPYSLDFHNFQSLHMAARRANIEIVRLLLNDGIPATAYDQTILDGTNSSGEDGPRNIDGTLVLHAAAVSGNLEVFNYCLNMGFSLRQKDRHGKTVLEYVCLFASDELIERILKLIGPIDCQDRSSYPWSLLHLACRKGSFKTLKLLYDAGFRVWSVKTSQPLVDWAPLDIARYCSNTRLIAQDGTILKDLPWSNIAQSGLVRANDETGTIEGVFKNSLKPSRKSFTGGCDGCLSEIIGLRAKCQQCFDIDYCIICRHTSEVNNLHAGHDMLIIEPE